MSFTWIMTGIFIGVVFGMFITALCVVAGKDADQDFRK